MGFNRRKLEDQRLRLLKKEAANRRAIDAQVLKDAERLITARKRAPGQADAGLPHDHRRQASRSTSRAFDVAAGGDFRMPRTGGGSGDYVSAIVFGRRLNGKQFTLRPAIKEARPPGNPGWSLGWFVQQNFPSVALAVSCASINAHAGGLDRCCPFIDFALEEAAEILRRRLVVRNDLCAEAFEPITHRGRVHRRKRSVM